MNIQLLLVAFVIDIELHMNYICGYLTSIEGNYGYLHTHVRVNFRAL